MVRSERAIMFSVTGCAVGYNYTLFMTKSNFGVDIDTKPPTAEVSLSRREVVLEPTFEGGKTPSVFATFKAQNNTVESFFFGVDSLFAGSCAATRLSKVKAKDGTLATDQPVAATHVCSGGATEENVIQVTKEPKGETLWEMIPSIFLTEQGTKIPGAGAVKPFFFATDTTLGLKVAWAGTTAQFPDSLKLGFNRKEFAFAPVFREGKECSEAHPCKIRMPSFLAGVKQSVNLPGTLFKFQVNGAQVFATGEAAENLALDPLMDAWKKEMLGPEKVEEKPK
jgi:hypothetical protein